MCAQFKLNQSLVLRAQTYDKYVYLALDFLLFFVDNVKYRKFSYIKKGILSMYDDIKIDILCKIAHSQTLQEATNLAYELFGNPVFISDMAHTILSYSTNAVIHRPEWDEIIETARIQNLEIHVERAYKNIHKDSIRQEMPILVNDNFIPFPRLIKALHMGEYQIGAAVLTAFNKPFDLQDAYYFELFTTYLIPLIQKENFQLSNDTGNLTNYFIKILNGDIYNPENISNIRAADKYKKAQNLYVLCYGVSLDIDQTTSYLVNKILDDFNALEDVYTFFYNGKIICIVTAEMEIQHWQKQMTALSDTATKYDLVAGVSRVFHAIEHLREHYIQANSSLELGLHLKRPIQYFPYDDLAIFHILQMIPGHNHLKFCHPNIRKLEEYDRKNHTDLCKTLQIYLENNKSLIKTAESLFVHRNTVSYRIKRCLELLNTTLEDGNELFTYTFSLRILEFERQGKKW